MAEQNPKILCLDDRPDNLRIRKMLLEQFGCDVVTVTEAQECLQTASDGAFNLVLLDYHLGSTVNGEDVARDLRSCRPSIPLVLLTGDPDIPDSAKASVDAVLIKGQSNPGDLLRTIQSLLPDFDLREHHRSIVSTIFPDSRPGPSDGLREIRKPVENDRPAFKVVVDNLSNRT